MRKIIYAVCILTILFGAETVFAGTVSNGKLNNLPTLKYGGNSAPKQYNANRNTGQIQPNRQLYTLNAEESKYEEKATKVLENVGWSPALVSDESYEYALRSGWIEALKLLKTAADIRKNPLIIHDYATLAVLGSGCENESAEEMKYKQEGEKLSSANYDKYLKARGGDYAAEAHKNYKQGIKLWKAGKRSASFKFFKMAAEYIDKEENAMTPMSKFIYWHSYVSYNSNQFDLYRGVVAYLYETGKAGVKDKKKATMWKSKLNSGTMLASEVFAHAKDEEFGYYECE